MRNGKIINVYYITKMIELTLGDYVEFGFDVRLWRDWIMVGISDSAFSYLGYAFKVEEKTVLYNCSIKRLFNEVITIIKIDY